MLPSFPATAVLLVLSLPVPAIASAKSTAGHRRPATAPHSVTADELIAVVFPERRDDAATGATDFGPTAIPVRRLESDEEPEVLEGVTELGAGVAQTVPDGPDMRHVLYLEVHGELVNDFTPFAGDGALVAVIDAGPSRQLLDLVEVKGDRESDFWWNGPWSRLGPGARAFIATSEHHNSSQNYHSYSVLTVQHGRIRTVAMLQLLSWGTETEDVTETPSFRVVRRRGRALGDFVATVTVDRRPYRGSSERRRTRRSVHTYRGIFRWQGPEKGWVEAGGTIDRLHVLNARHY